MKLIDLHFSPSELLPYINWIYFYHTWGIKNYNHDATAKAEAQKIKDEAIHLLDKWDSYGLQTHFRCCISEANSSGEDIIIHDDKSKEIRLPLLRQQQSPYLCLADYLPPVGQPKEKIGFFASTVPFKIDGLLSQTTADRLAEAAAELGHQRVRTDKDYWGYTPEEKLSPEELFQEKYQGIRPAIGYPSLPDQSIIFDISQILDFPTLGIKLTESGAMLPHSSTAGLLISHPKARYFSIGTIGKDQLSDYATRRDIPEENLKKFLSVS